MSVAAGPAVSRVEASLPARPESVSAARELLACLLHEARIRGESHSDSLLVVSELVSNAVRHASGAGDEILIRFAVRGAELHLTVSDAAHGVGVPVALTPDERRIDGRGLQIVGCLAHWSERVVGGRREVSAVMALLENGGRSEPRCGLPSRKAAPPARFAPNDQ